MKTSIDELLRDYEMINVSDERLISMTERYMSTMGDSQVRCILHILLNKFKSNLSTHVIESPIEISHNVSLDDEPKPLTTKDLMKGGWWMSSATEEDQQVFMIKGLPIEDIKWGGRNYKSCSLLAGKVAAWFGLNSNKEPNEIHRIGTDFFWGAPALED
jgi:hypothetical protein